MILRKIKKFFKKERRIWHKRFIPSFIGGIAVAIVSFFFKFSGANIAMFASVGASAAILTNKYRHHLVMLKTILLSYVVSGIIGILILLAGRKFTALHTSLQIFFVITLSIIALYSFDIFHPPAISAALAVVLYDRSIIELLFLFLSVMILFIIIRFSIYVFYEHHRVRDFVYEFIREIK